MNLLIFQLIRDVVTVSEATNWSKSSSAESKYKTLNCDIKLLDPQSSDFDMIAERFLGSQTG